MSSAVTLARPSTTSSVALGRTCPVRSVRNARRRRDGLLQLLRLRRGGRGLRWGGLAGRGLVDGRVAGLPLRRGAPGDGTRRTAKLAAGLLVAHIAFNVVKLIGYGETEVRVFFAVGLTLLVLLAVGPRGRRAGDVPGAMPRR